MGNGWSPVSRATGVLLAARKRSIANRASSGALRMALPAAGFKLILLWNKQFGGVRSARTNPPRGCSREPRALALSALHETAPDDVIIGVKPRPGPVVFFLLPLLSVAADLPKVLKDVEIRYNHTKTLEVRFDEIYQAQGRTRNEAGNLFLRKPGRMRWQYTNPPGKLFVSDGKAVYFYSPDTNRAEKMKLKETEDMRAPLAFLLGRLEFNRDFGRYSYRQEGSALFITAVPKSDKLPYREVSFVVTQDSRIERLIVRGQDSSVLDFSFSGEKVNPPINDQMFRFQLPKGAELVDSSDEPGQGVR